MNTFGRRVGVEFFGDAAPLERSFASLAAATKEYGALSVATNAKVTDAQIAGTVKQIESLRAQQAEFAAAATSGVRSAKEQEAAQIRLAAVSRRLAGITGESTAATVAFAGGARTAERDFGKTTRGVLAGSGVFRGLGRSLAFASSGFIAVAAGATLIRSSIAAAESLAKAQASLSVAIRHTGGDVAKLQPEYLATAKAAAQFGVSQVDATTGLARATVLTGDAAKAQRAYQEALVISKATGKDFNVVLTATAKGQEGITTSLRRYGILVKTGESGTAQFTQVMQRFGGQAAANTTASDKLRAVFANTEAVIGEQLLPTFERLAASLAAWLTKMNETGRLQKDVNGIMQAAGDVFHLLGGAIGFVDKVTGGFGNTLKVIVGFKLVPLVTGWAASLETLAAKWGGVTVAATEAQAAEARALTLGNTPTVLPFNVPKSPTLAERVGQYTGEGGAGAAALGRTSFAARTGLARFLAPEGLFTLGDRGETQSKTRVGPDGFVEMQFNGRWYRGNFVGLPSSSAITLPGFKRPGTPVNPFSQFALPPGFGSTAGGGGTPARPFGAATPIAVFAKFQLTQLEELAQARAGLTRGTSDDVTAAKGVIARIKALIAGGHLSGNSLIQALQSEASALGTIWSAEDAAAQARAQKAQQAQQRIQAALQNLIDPLNLEVDLSREQATGKSTLATLRALRASAEKAIASGKLSLDQQKQAYDQITSLNQQIKDAATAATATFTAPAKLQLALARDAALGLPQTKDLLRLKAAILKFIRTHKKNTQALIDAYNQLAAVNQQLGSSAQSALGLFKEASTKALTADLGLNAAQRKALRQRLAGLGPGQTVSGSGVGAAGYAIDPKTGRPIVLHRHQRRNETSSSGGGGGGGRPLVVDSNIDLNVYIDGRHVEATVTRRQQKRRSRNPSQRRGPNAGG